MSEPVLESAAARWFSRWGLFHWLSLLVAAPLLLLGVAAAINAQREYAAAERQALAQALTLARHAAARLDEHYDELDQFLTAVAEVARETLLRGVDGDPALTRMIQATPQHVTGLSILSLEGRMLASTTAAPEMRATENVADRAYFKNAMAGGRLAVGEPVYARTTDLWVSVAARPVFDDAGRIIGAVSTSSRLDRIQTILVPAALPAGTLMAVFNEHGIGIAGSARPGAAPGRDFASLDTVRRVLRERELNAKAQASDGRWHYLAYAVGKKLPWIVEVGLPLETVLAPARQQLFERLLLLAAAAVLGLAAAARLARRIGQPIRDLARDADELGKGMLSRRSQANGYREVARLGNALNAMAGTIEAKQREFKASEERLRESEGHLRATLEYSPNVAVQWYDREGRVRFWNNASTAVFGWTEAEAMGRTLEEIGLYTPAQFSGFIDALGLVDQEGPRGVPEESAFRRKDGMQGVIVSTLFPISSPSGERLYVCMDVDVTLRAQLEKEIKERIELFRVTLDTPAVCIALIRTRDNMALLTNRATNKTFDVDLASKSWNVAAHWERKEDLAEMLNRIKRDGYARDMEVPVHIPGRDRMWAQLSAHPARYLGEDVLVVTLNDITERKQLEVERDAVEAALRASESKFRALTELSSDWYWEQDEQYRFTSYSTEFQLSPTEALQLLGRTRWELHGEPVDETWDQHRACLERRETFRGRLFRYQRAGRPVRFVEISGTPVFDESGDFRGYRGTCTDVTRRVRLETDLKERMELLRVTLDTSPVATALVRVSDNVVLLANRAAYQTFRVDPNAREWNVLDHRDRPGDLPEFTRRIQRDGFVSDMEVPVLIPERGRAWMLVAAQPGRLQGENIMVVAMHDITERKELEAQRDAAEHALRESEIKFRALTALSSDWYWEQDAELRFTFIGRDDVRQALQIIGKRREETNAEPVSESWEANQARLMRREKFRDVVYRYVTDDGETHYVSVSGEPKYDEAGVFQGYRGTGTEVTARIKLENELRERVNLFRITLDTTPVGIGLVRRRDNQVLLANRAGYALFRRDPASPWDVTESWARIEDMQEMLRRVASDGEARDMEAPIVVPERENVWTSMSAQPATYMNENVLVVTVTDVTERRQLQAQREALLEEARRANERLTHLSRQVLDAQEDERRKIAHELHDEIGQNLTALKLMAGHLRVQLLPGMKEPVDEWIALLDQAIGQVRDLSRLLRPVQLDLMGLVPALRALLYTQARAAGWSVELTAEDDIGRIDTRVETVAYRVVQEALSNAARHADAARVTLEVYVHRDNSGNKLTLRIADDGRGYDVQGVRKRVQGGLSMGLLGMEERVRLIGGKISVQSAPTRGTRINVTIPFAAENQEVNV